MSCLLDYGAVDFRMATPKANRDSVANPATISCGACGSVSHQAETFDFGPRRISATALNPCPRMAHRSVAGSAELGCQLGGRDGQ